MNTSLEEHCEARVPYHLQRTEAFSVNASVSTCLLPTMYKKHQTAVIQLCHVLSLFTKLKRKILVSGWLADDPAQDIESCEVGGVAGFRSVFFPFQFFLVMISSMLLT